MQQRYLQTLVFAFLFTLCSGCVSVQLPGGESKKSRGVAVAAPSSSYVSFDLPGADQAWKSRSSGNTISYYSDCSTNPISLERQQEDTLNGILNSKVISSQKIEFDSREAIETLAESKIEGIAMQIAFLNYTKNTCRYTLTYAARKSFFEKENFEFEKFKKGFRAP